MARRSSRTKTNPFRILAACLFWEVPWVSRFQAGVDTHVSVRTGALRLYLDIPSERLGMYLEWLETKGYIRGLTKRRGEADFIVRIPSTWNWDAPGDGPNDKPDEPPHA